MALNLTGPKATAERLLLVDEGVITSDPQGTTDDVWDDNTGTYGPATGDKATVYSGPMFFDIASGSLVTSAAREQAQVTGQVQIPLEVIEVKPGQQVTCTDIHAGGDEGLIGRTFRIKTVGGGTYVVLRQLDVEERTGAEPSQE